MVSRDDQVPSSLPAAELLRDELPIGVMFVNTDLRVGGQERALVEIVRGLDRTKIRPVVVCLKEEGALAAAVRETGAPLHSGLLRHKFDLRVLRRLMDLIRRERIRVICTVGSGDKMFWGRLAGRLARVDAIVSTIHKTRGADGRAVIGRANRVLTPITDAFVAVAENAARYLIEEEGLPPSKVVVIRNGVDVERFRGEGRGPARAALGLRESDVAIVHVAVLRPEKGHDVLLRAARRVVDECAHARFLLVGEGPRRAAIEQLIAELGLRDNVRLLGQRDDVERILAAGDVAVLASRDRVETFPNSILEAMASGLPCVCTRVGSIEEMIEHGVEGHLVPPEDPVTLAAALVRLARDRGLRMSLGEKARDRARREFPRERMIRTREQLFLRLVAAATLRRRVKLEG